MGQERGSSSGTWGDYMTGFDRNPRATSGSKGAPSHRSGQSRPESSGWGSSGADGPDWGSSANNNENPSNGWSNEPGASSEQASSSRRDTQASGWGSSGDRWGSSGNAPPPSNDGWGSSGNAPPPSNDGWGSSGNALTPSNDGWGSSGNAPPPSNNGWGSSGNAPPPSRNGLESSGNAWGSSGNALESGYEWGSSGNDLGSGWGSAGDAWGSGGTDQGPGWGETPISDQDSKAPSAGAVAKLTEPDAVLGGTGVDGKLDALTATTRSSRVSVAPASRTDVQESGGAKPVHVAISSTPIRRVAWFPGELHPTHNEECGEDTFEPATVSLSVRNLRTTFLIHCFRSLWPVKKRSKCDRRMLTKTIISFRCYRTATIWGS